MVKSICAKHGAEFLPDTPIAPYTSFKIGGNCNIVKINGVNALSELLLYCKHNNIPRYIFGNCSNILVSDNGLDGLVLLISSDFSKISVDGEYISCQSGARLAEICKSALEYSLSGLEFAYGIPGTAGGAVCMNAGAYGGEMKDAVISCAYLDGDCVPREADVSELELSYRHSVFSEKDWVVTGVKLKAGRGEKAAIKEKMDEIASARLLKQPLEYPSAGSAFKRPKGYYAAKLIDDAGLRGRSLGNAQVSEKHCGFIVNKGNATFNDVVGLIEIVKDTVYAKTGVTLECEVKIIE